MKTPRRQVAFAAAIVAGSVLGAPAAAYLCHKDPPGTRVLLVHGQVAHYSAVGTRVAVAFRGIHGCRSVVWDARARTVQRARGSCAVAHQDRALAGLKADVETSEGRPPVMNVRSHGRVVHRWALPAMPLTLARVGDLAVFSAAGGAGLYGIRLSDGLVGLVGPNRPHDTPRLTHAGVFYQDDEFKRDRKNGVVRLKFVPTRGVSTIIDRGQLPVVTSGAVEALAMDGPRVALAVTDPARRCDRVLYWNVAWRPVQRISAPNGPTCALKGHTAITRVAIGGFRAAWLRSAGSEQSIVAGSPKCQEWVIRRLQMGAGGDTVSAISGDGKTLAFAIVRHERELRGSAEIGVVSGRFRAVDIASRRGSPDQLAVDGTHVAILWDDGVAEVRGLRGRLLQQVDVGRARAIALTGDVLLALRPGRIEAYSLLKRQRVGAWPISRGVNDVDVHFDIAVFHSDHLVYGLDLRSGRSVVLGRTASPIVGAQIEAAGVAYAYNFGSHGIARFLPIAAVERALHR